MSGNEVEQVRRLLSDADPLAPDDFIGAVHDDRARADFARILTNERPSPSPLRRFLASRRRRRWSAVGVAAVIVLGGGAAATAGGLVPDGVIAGFHKGHGSGSDPIEHVHSADAVKAGQIRLPSGTLLQLWVAPNEAGGDCEYNRVLRPAHEPEDGSLACSSAPEMPEADTVLWTQHGQEEGRDVVFVRIDMRVAPEIKSKFGVDVRKAHAARITSADGATRTLPVIRGRVFGAIPRQPVSLDLLTDRGAVIYHYRMQKQDYCGSGSYDNRSGCPWS